MPSLSKENAAAMLLAFEDYQEDALMQGTLVSDELAEKLHTSMEMPYSEADLNNPDKIKDADSKAEVQTIADRGYKIIVPEGMSRISRAQMLKLKEQEFVLASRTLGASSNRIIFKEILPNIISQLITNTMFSIPNAIFTEAFLSFVGLGIPTPMCSLGSLISDAYKSFTTHPYQIIPPVLVLALLMLCFNLLGDGLRDAFDPKMKQM